MRKLELNEILNYLIPPESYRFPMDLSEIFKDNLDNRFLGLEIGIGNGIFLVEVASKFPQRFFIGVEKSLRFLKDAIRRLDNASVNNVKLFNSFGELVVRDILPNNSIDEVYVNFPDPWPKKAHVKRRLLNRRFLRVLSRRGKLGLKLWLLTDHHKYRDWVLDEVPKELYKAHWGVGIPQWVPQTKYMRKWLSEGKEIYHVILELRKRDEDQSLDERLRRVRDMIQVKFIGDNPIEKLSSMKGFTTKLTDSSGRTRAILKILDIISEGERSWLECLIVEVTELYNLEQRILLKLSRDPKGYWWLRSEALGQVILTPNALKLVEKLLEELNPSEVAYSNL